MLSRGLQTIPTKRTFKRCLKHFQTKHCGNVMKFKENNMKNKCNIKKALFLKISFENTVPLNTRLRIQPRFATVEKWPEFLQNASGNPGVCLC